MNSPKGIVLLAPLCVVLALGPSCVFLEIPEERSLEEAAKPIPWLKAPLAAQISSFSELAASLDVEAAPADAGRCLVDFLHISDAQVRDEVVFDKYGRTQLWFWDYFIDVTQRLSRVQVLDSFGLASFLASWSRAAAPGGAVRFVIHTGDLLDVSIVTELVETMNVLRAYEVASGANGPELLSCAGNHDGLVFGNLPDHFSKTWGLGINRAEFVLGHFLGGKPSAKSFGFEGNEILQLARRGGTSILEPLHSTLLDLEELSRLPDLVRIQTLPYAFREAVGVSGKTEDDLDDAGVQLGYYSRRLALSSGEFATLRVIVLDTRSPAGASGFIGAVQQGWLYEELRQAHEAREVVLLFGHHALDEIACEPATDLSRFLRASGVVAGYFYGHGHWNEVDCPDGAGAFPCIQTGSITDFPQLGRRVRIVQDARGLRFEWSYYRPRARRDSTTGWLVHALLELSQESSEQEHNGRYSMLPRKWLTSLGIVRGSKAFVPDFEKWLGRQKTHGSCPIRSTFSDAFPSPCAMFGTSQAAEIHERRVRLGL